MEQDRVRIVDVADALGLSTATVSKVIFRTWLDSPKNFLTFFQFWVLLFLYNTVYCYTQSDAFFRNVFVVITLYYKKASFYFLKLFVFSK